MTGRSEAAVQVLIIGGGPVGLALAGDLGWRGVSCLLIEQTEGGIGQPRMDRVGLRTMEFCRRWGIDSAVRNAGYPRDYPQDIVYVTSLLGWEIAREPLPSMAACKPPAYSPTYAERCPQNFFDPVLKHFAASQPGVELRYRHRLLSLKQTPEAVLAEVEECTTGRVVSIRASYLVGCDGTNSTVRKCAGIANSLEQPQTYSVNALLRHPDLNRLHGKAPGYRFVMVSPTGVWATVVAINGRDQWRVQFVGDDVPRRWSDDEVRWGISRIMGGDFNYELMSVVHWTRRQQLAAHYRSGRVFIAGDAAHSMSPTGGFGMNTGIADAVDLGWKLEATIKGWGGDGLLDTYEIERRPVAQWAIECASENLTRMQSVRFPELLLDDGSAGEAIRQEAGRAISSIMRREWFTPGVQVGFRYDSPICWPDGSPAPKLDPNVYVPSARPGSRAPHAYLSDGTSLLDQYGKDFVLLMLEEHDSDPRPLIQAAAQRRVPLKVLHLRDRGIRRLHEKRHVLVRPDGHVAWRSDSLPRDSLQLIDRVRGATSPWRSRVDKRS